MLANKRRRMCKENKRTFQTILLTVNKWRNSSRNQWKRHGSSKERREAGFYQYQKQKMRLFKTILIALIFYIAFGIIVYHIAAYYLYTQI